VTVTIGHVATGEYSFKVTGLGNGCPIATFTPYGGSFTLYFAGGGCAGGTEETTVFTSNGQNEDWAYSATGIDPPAATSFRALPRLRHRRHHL
jgi:hypothetical protein